MIINTHQTSAIKSNDLLNLHYNLFSYLELDRQNISRIVPYFENVAEDFDDGIILLYFMYTL